MNDESFPSRSTFTLKDLFTTVIVIGLVLGFVSMLLPRVGSGPIAPRFICSNNLKQLALACLNFHDVNNRLPVARLDERREHGLSGTDPGEMSALGPNWIVLASPYFENQAMYDEFMVNPNAEIANGTWKPAAGETKSPYMWNHDSKLPDGTLTRSAGLSILECPKDEGFERLYTGIGGNWGRGNYAINAGPCELMNGPGPSPCRLNSTGPPWGLTAAGVSNVNWGADLKDVASQDGTAYTVLIAEIRIGVSPDDIRGTWALGYPGASVLANAGLPNSSNPNHPRADRIPNCFKIQTAVGGEKALARLGMGCDPAATGAEQTAARSMHKGGVNVAFCDGSVHFISDKIDARMWYRMLSARDGEQVSFGNE